MRFGALWSDIAWVRPRLRQLAVTLALSYDGPEITIPPQLGSYTSVVAHLIGLRSRAEYLTVRRNWETGYWRIKFGGKGTIIIKCLCVNASSIL